jgi:GTP-binding protein
VRTVAIVGRPNVGKSALFNRLAGRKISIVHDQPGVTRDRVCAVCHLGSSPFEIIDTGGIGATPDPEFSAQTRMEAEAAIASADVLLLVVDGQAGIHPLDAELASQLRASGKPLFLAVNKVDLPQHEIFTSDFAGLGLEHMFPVSAAHGFGIDELVQSLGKSLPADDEEEAEIPGEEIPPARVVLIGRPNVGKSSLTNAILGHPRTIVSGVAGTTRDAVDIPFQFAEQKYMLCDTAGMRHRSRHNTSVEVFSVMRSERALRGADLCLLIIDATQGVTGQDKKIGQMVQKSFKPVLIVLNKFDAVESRGSPRETLAHHVEHVRQELFFLRFAPVVILSAKTGQNVERLFLMVEKMRQHARRRIGTGELNRHLQKCFEAQPPPLRRNRRLKILYATQVEPSRRSCFAPPEIVFFVNDQILLPATYEEFLQRRIREKWEFPGLPLRFRWRSRDDKNSDTPTT